MHSLSGSLFQRLHNDRWKVLVVETTQQIVIRLIGTIVVIAGFDIVLENSSPEFDSQKSHSLCQHGCDQKQIRPYSI